MLRVGIIGLGTMGRVHLEAYAKIEGVEVIGISDADPKRAGGDLSGTELNLGGGEAKGSAKKLRGTTDWRELLRWPEVDIVDVCVPTPAHPEIAVAALQAGKHVVCEKPLARTSEEAQRIADVAAKATGFFMPAMVMRFWPQWAWLKQAIDEKRYGKVLSATFRRVASMPGGWFRDGKLSGGAALDLHIHDTDFINYVFGKPKGVFSRGYITTTGAMDHLVTQYLYDHVPQVSAEGGWCFSEGWGFRMQYAINFESASADFDLARAEPLMLYQKGKAEPIPLGTEYGYVKELEYFVGCVKSGKRPTIVTAQDAVDTIRIIEAEVRSVATGNIVSI